MGAAMHRSLVCPDGIYDGLVDVARGAEEQGLHRVWTTEWASRDSVVRAQMIAAATSTLRVGTGIAYAFTRSPVAAAAQAADAYVTSGGRFTLGLGVGTRGVRQRYFGVVDFDRAVSRLVEYVEILRRAWAADGSLSFAGEFYEINAPDFCLDQPAGALAGLEVCAAGVAPVMLRAAARSCDGVLLHALTRVQPYLDQHVLPALAAGASQRDAPPWVAMWIVAAVDQDEEMARACAKRTLAFYLTTPSYANTVAGSRWQAPVAALQDAFRTQAADPDWDALDSLLPDTIVDELALAGTPTQVGARLAAVESSLAARGIAELVLQPAVIGLAPEDAREVYRGVVNSCGGLAATTSGQRPAPEERHVAS